MYLFFGGRLFVFICKDLVVVSKVSSSTGPFPSTPLPSAHCILVTATLRQSLNTPGTHTHTWFRGFQKLFSVSADICKADTIPLPICAHALLSE